MTLPDGIFRGAELERLTLEAERRAVPPIKRLRLINEVLGTINRFTPYTIAELIVDEGLHPAIQIDWEKV
jgi:hypothetical protein